MPNLKIEQRELKDLQFPKYNPRTMTEEEMQKLKNSITEFGYVEPIIINEYNNHIIGGNHRAKALKELGYTTVNAVILHIEDLNREKTLNIALNKIVGGFDKELLEKTLQEIELSPIDVNLTGFDNLELEELKINNNINNSNNDNSASDLKEHTEDNYAGGLNEKDVNVKVGDVYVLGNHHLMCGDSTVKGNVDRLLDGAEINMVFTDPPYNINYSGIKDKRTIKNDKMEDDEFVEFLKKSLPYCDTSYICCSWQYAHLFKEAMNQLDMPPKAMIIWDKVNPAQNLDKYYKQHEIIWYYGKFGGEKTIRGDIWECKRQRNTFHPTMKPIELISMAIQDNPDKQNIYDGFGGSGSTLIACEQLNRNCYMMELDPYYCQVIINRWEEYTGEKAEKIN